MVTIRNLLWLVVSAAGAVDAMVPLVWEGLQYNCKCTPADSCWPKEAEWNALNETVGGNLLLNKPPGAVCHNSFAGIKTYDAEACKAATASWTSEQWQ
jgi:hypothetical protein